MIEILTDSPKPKRYWTDIISRSEKESRQGHAECVPLKIEAKDGRNRLRVCANTEGVLRIIMSILSPKAELFKLSVKTGTISNAQPDFVLNFSYTSPAVGCCGFFKPCIEGMNSVQMRMVCRF